MVPAPPTRRRASPVGPESQGLVWNLEDVAGIANNDPKLRRHSRQEQEVRIWRGNDCCISDDVLHDLGRLANLHNLSAEDTIPISVHCELGGLTHFQLADIRFVDLPVDLHLTQIVRDLE